MPEILVTLSFFFFPISKAMAIWCLVLGLLARTIDYLVSWDKGPKKLKQEDKILVINGKTDNNIH